MDIHGDIKIRFRDENSLNKFVRDNHIFNNSGWRDLNCKKRIEDEINLDILFKFNCK